MQESHCTQKADATGAGMGVCADTPDLDPTFLSVAAPGESVTISMPGATLATDGDAAVAVRPLGCHDRELLTVALGPQGVEWSVELEPGAYELQAFARFEAENGLSGETAASLGLLVDPAREAGIVEASPDLFVCAPSEQG